MVLRNSKIIAFDGTHASGKTTLIYAVAARLRFEGLHVAVLPEPARSSPFVDDVVIHQAGHFDMLLELDIFAAHLTNCVRAARSHQLVLSDKTLVNVLAYTRLLVDIQPGSWDQEMVRAMETWCQVWGRAYDAVFFTQDHYGNAMGGTDRYRSRVTHLQDQADRAVREEYARLGPPIIEIPLKLDLEARCNWVIAAMRERAIIA